MPSQKPITITRSPGSSLTRAWLKPMGLGLWLWSCATTGGAPAGSDAANHLALRLKPNTAWIVQVTPDGMMGPTVNLGFYGNSIRGNLGKASIDLETSDSAVSGTAPAWTQLSVTATPTGFTATGELDGKPAHFELSDTGFRGLISQCDYDLKPEGTIYKGTGSCQSPWPIELELPQSLSGLSAPMRAAVIALALDHGS